jgi:hypothetical protein
MRARSAGEVERWDVMSKWRIDVTSSASNSIRTG